MNSSSVAASAFQPRPVRRSICALRICRGEATTGEWSCYSRSAGSSAVPGSHGVRRSVVMSGTITKSP